MIISPIQNEALLHERLFVQRRPHMTQKFGENPDIYEKFGHKGHNGLDFACKEGTELFAPIDGIIKIKDQGDKGYGLYVTITNDRLQVILAHLQEVFAIDGSFVHMGDFVAHSGNSGFSTGPHLHMTVKQMVDGKVFNRKNGFNGAFDFEDYVLTWKGTLNKYEHE